MALGAFLALAWIAPEAAQAGKPSLRRAIKDAGFKNVIKCKFKSRGKITPKLLKVYYTRQMECVMKGGVKGRPKIKKVHDGYVEYLKRGSRYTYVSWFPWSTWYLGLKPPKKELVVELVKKNKLKFLGRSYHHGYIVGDLEKVRVADKPMWVWSSPNKLRVSVIGNYRWKKGGNEVEDVQHLKWVYLGRDDIDKPWKYTGAGKTNVSADRKVLSVKKYSSDEYNKLKTIAQLAGASAAKAALASLPKVKVPIFKSGEELVAYTWKMLRTATPKQMEAYLRQTYSSYHFLKDNPTVLHPNAVKRMKQNIARALEGPSKFKDQYCKEPLKKKGDRASYWNKMKSSWSRISAVPGPGKWVEGKKVPGTYKISTFQISILKGSALARMKSYSKDKCPRELTAAEKALRVPKADGRGSWKIGDRVSCAYQGRRRWYPGKIAKINGNKLFIKYDDGGKEWTTAKFLKVGR